MPSLNSVNDAISLDSCHMWYGQTHRGRGDVVHSITPCTGSSFSAELWQQHHTAAKEMVSVVIAIAVWGPTWSSATVLALSDNMAVVSALSAGSARDLLLMHLLQCIHTSVRILDTAASSPHSCVTQYCSGCIVKGQAECLLLLLPPGTTQTISRATVPGGHATPQRTRLDILQLEDSVFGYIAEALALATLHTYGSGQRRYLAFCTAANLPPIPLVEHTLCMFVAYLAK